MVLHRSIFWCTNSSEYKTQILRFLKPECAKKYHHLWGNEIVMLADIARLKGGLYTQPPYLCRFCSCLQTSRVADVERAREQRSPKGQGLLRKEGPPTYAILSQNLVLSRFMRFSKGFHRAFNESHPAFKELSRKAILLS